MYSSVTLKYVRSPCCACVLIPGLACIRGVVICTLGGSSTGARSSEFCLPLLILSFPQEGCGSWFIYEGCTGKSRSPLRCLSEHCLALSLDFSHMLIFKRSLSLAVSWLPIVARPDWSVQDGEEEALQLGQSWRGRWTLIWTWLLQTM